MTTTSPLSEVSAAWQHVGDERMTHGWTAGAGMATELHAKMDKSARLKKGAMMTVTEENVKELPEQTNRICQGSIKCQGQSLFLVLEGSG
jgi:hypothetical protein